MWFALTKINKIRYTHFEHESFLHVRGLANMKTGLINRVTSTKIVLDMLPPAVCKWSRYREEI